MSTPAPTLPAGKLLHTIPSALERLGISRSALYDAINDGRLRALKNGGRTYIADQALVDFVAALEADPDAQYVPGARARHRAALADAEAQTQQHNRADHGRRRAARPHTGASR
jgi:excisionase family DNA binding protein